MSQRLEGVQIEQIVKHFKMRHIEGREGHKKRKPSLGMGQATKTDEFSENSEVIFDPNIDIAIFGPL